MALVGVCGGPQHGAPFLLLASSTTFQCFTAESWEQSPRAFQRLRALLAPRRGALVVSGDLHGNAVCDDSGVTELVSSAVARVGAVFKAQRRNWGLCWTSGPRACRWSCRV